MTESYFDNLWQILFFGGREYLSLMIGANNFVNRSLAIKDTDFEIGLTEFEISFRDDDNLFEISGVANLDGDPCVGYIFLEVINEHVRYCYVAISITELRERIEFFTNKSLEF